MIVLIWIAAGLILTLAGLLIYTSLFERGR